MPARGHTWRYKIKAPIFRLGRKATKHVRTQFDRFWLQAAVRLAANYVGFTPSTGNVGHVSLAMGISRSMWPVSAFCDSVCLTFKNRSREEARLSLQMTRSRLTGSIDFATDTT